MWLWKYIDKVAALGALRTVSALLIGNGIVLPLLGMTGSNNWRALIVGGIILLALTSLKERP